MQVEFEFKQNDTNINKVDIHRNIPTIVGNN